MGKATKYDLDSESSLLDDILTHYEDSVTNLDYNSLPVKSDYAVVAFDLYLFVNDDVSAEARSTHLEGKHTRYYTPSIGQ